jgi:hypothetical protein
MTMSVDIIIAIALVALVFVFVRISWTLKEINDTLVARGGAAATVNADLGKKTPESVETKAAVEERAIDETEIAAVIAIASQAMRAAS